MALDCFLHPASIIYAITSAKAPNIAKAALFTIPALSSSEFPSYRSRRLNIISQPAARAAQSGH